MGVSLKNNSYTLGVADGCNCEQLHGCLLGVADIRDTGGVADLPKGKYVHTHAHTW